MSSKRTRACNFTPKEREAIYQRDGRCCIFCAAGYRMNEIDPAGMDILEVMHYIPRSQGGLGSRRNSAIGCKSHHMMLDNGSKGYRAEMQDIFREYLKSNYSDWNEEDLVYNKWKEFAV